MSAGGILLPSVGKDAQLMVNKSEPGSPKTPKSPKSAKSISSKKSKNNDDNMFLLTKEEELRKVHKAASRATLDKEHEETRFAIHNLAVRAGSDQQRAKARMSYIKKMKKCALSMNPRSIDPAGVAALRVSSVQPRDFQQLCKRCLSLPLTDLELSEVVFEYGDHIGRIDGQKFMVKMLKMGKAAKSERLMKEVKANREVHEHSHRFHLQKIQQSFDNKVAHVDYSFTNKDTAFVVDKLSEWALKHQVCGVRAVGVGGLNGFIQTKISPTELRDQVQRAFGYLLSSKQLGALVVHMLNHQYRSLEVAHAMAPLPSTQHSIDSNRRRRARTVPSNAMRGERTIRSNDNDGNDSVQNGISSHMDDGASSSGLNSIAASDIDQWERKSALFKHPNLKRIIEEQGEVVLNASTFVAVMRVAGLEKEEEIRRNRIIAKAQKESEKQMKLESKIYEARFDKLPRSNMTVFRKAPLYNLSTFSDQDEETLSRHTNHHHFGIDESFEAEKTILQSSLEKIAQAAKYYDRRALSGAGLKPLMGSGMSFREFQMVLDKTLDIRLTSSEIEALAGYLARGKSENRASVLSIDVGDVDHRDKIDPTDFVKLFFLLRSKKVMKRGELPHCNLTINQGSVYSSSTSSSSLASSSMRASTTTGRRGGRH